MISIAALIMFAGVSLGALGAHALESRLMAIRPDGPDTWETAVTYHLIHGVALLVLAIWRETRPAPARARLLAIVGWMWIAGIAAFSGSLYGLALGGPKFLGPVTPLGGLLFLGGWIVLAITARPRGSAAGAA